MSRRPSWARRDPRPAIMIAAASAVGGLVFAVLGWAIWIEAIR